MDVVVVETRREDGALALVELPPITMRPASVERLRDAKRRLARTREDAMVKDEATRQRFRRDPKTFDSQKAKIFRAVDPICLLTSVGESRLSAARHAIPDTSKSGCDILHLRRRRNAYYLLVSVSCRSGNQRALSSRIGSRSKFKLPKTNRDVKRPDLSTVSTRRWMWQRLRVG
jgi:hypothetical protein